MLGLFGKKKEEKPVELPAEYKELVVKWDVFLDKIKNRFDESLVNAEEAIFDNLDETNYDLGPTMTAWHGIKASLHALADKIDETFDQKVKPQMLNYVEKWNILDQSVKGSEVRHQLLSEIERFELILEGKVSERFYNHAIQALHQDFHCTQCSAKLEVRTDVFRSHYVSCDYCNTVNTFTPNDKIAAIRWVVDNIAKYKSLQEWDAMKQAENEYRETRFEDTTTKERLFKKREESLRIFWTKFFTERSAYLPEYKETIEPDVDNKMKWFYEERKRELNY